jgi:hypothetical protein
MSEISSPLYIIYNSPYYRARNYLVKDRLNDFIDKSYHRGGFETQCLRCKRSSLDYRGGEGRPYSEDVHLTKSFSTQRKPSVQISNPPSKIPIQDPIFPDIFIHQPV